jgi:hypothetical protein
MSITGTSSPAIATTLVPGADGGHLPSSMRRPSATGGSSRVRIRPTMTALPVRGPTVAAASVGAADPPSDEAVMRERLAYSGRSR